MRGGGLALSPMPALQGMNPSYDEYADSDEDQHDAYLERMKEEGKIREENANDSSDESGEETGGLGGLAGSGVGSSGGGAHTACALFQMSPSTRVKRRRMWQRSESWVYPAG